MFSSSSLHLPGIFVAVNLVMVLIVSKLLPLPAKTRYLLLLAQYLVLFEAVFILITRMLYRKLVNKYPANSSFGLILRIFLAPIFLMAQTCVFLQYHLAGNEPKLLTLLVGYSFGFVMYILTSLLVFEVFSLAIAFAMKKRNGVQSFFQSQKTKKEELISLIMVLAASIGCFIAAHKHATDLPPVRYINVPIKNLPTAFNNTVIVQLSDLHIGMVNGKTALEKVVAISNSLKPDIVALTGDIAEGKVSQIGHALRPISNLKSKYGVFITTGNHDYYTADIDRWLERWEEQGLKVLQNKRLEISNHKQHFYLAGIDDTEGKFFRGEHHGPNYEAALGNRDTKIPTILLTHRPSVSKKAMTNYGNIQLALSGHTHGGQFPLTGLFHYLSEPYFYGLYQFDSQSFVYVSTGVFYWVAPLRLIAEGEITHITLICS